MARHIRLISGDLESDLYYFEWQAFSILDGYNKQTFSPTFLFFGVDAVLQMTQFNINSISHTVFVLRSRFELDQCNNFHTTSIIDSEGKVRFNSKGRLVDGTGNVLLTVSSSYLREIQEKGNLTVRFKWFANEICGRGFHRCKDSMQPKCKIVQECSAQKVPTQTKVTRDSCTNTEAEEKTFFDVLSKDLGNFYEGRTDTDCVLRVAETKFPIHRSVLSARSNVFAAMFHQDTAQSQSGEVDIRDVDADALGDVIYYIYTGKVRGLSSNTAASMYVVADRYCLFELKDECLNILMKHLTLENVCEAALLAHTHAEKELENLVMQFIKERMKELLASEKWREFSNSHCNLANKLLCSILLAN